ncbi:MAG: phosphatidate cytidylyltransferase [Bacteroidales bacterium]|nr:phosphatidate cytidylyltransferase [Bacteroidales bacterium]
MVALYFLAGAIAIIKLNGGKSGDLKKLAWLKYLVYLIIVVSVLSLIIFTVWGFFLLALFIIIGGSVEIISMFGKIKTPLTFIMIFMFYLLISFCFLLFTKIDYQYSVLVYLVVAIFDGMSQVGGQMFGNRKLVPSISPQKTVSGLISGIIFSGITIIILAKILHLNFGLLPFFYLIIVGPAFIGDLLASLLKRKTNIKDFSSVIPGHGGILDRFDSLLMSGALFYVAFKLMEI